MENQGNFPAGQTQMRRDAQNPPSDVHSQAQSNFLQETGNSVSSMVQGAADVGKGATQGALSLARGVAFGAANIAQGASDVVKNTMGANTNNNSGPGRTGPNDVEGLNYHTMGDSTHPNNTSDPTYPGNPNTRI